MENKRNLKKAGRREGFLIAAAVILLLTGCSASLRGEDAAAGEGVSAERAETGFVVTGPDSYDSADTAVCVSKDEKEGTMTFLNLELGKRYTLSLDGTTCFYDRYGEGISSDQVEAGDVVDIRFLKSKKHLTMLTLSPAAWKYENVEKYELNSVRGEVSIGSDIYKLTSDTQYFSGDRSVGSMDLNPADILSFQGIDSQVLSVRVEKGHGYLRLVNDENFIGGWIEIGQTQIRKITEDMLLSVPEGSYQVSISNKGGGGTKSVVIVRNEETALDIGDLEIPEPQYGMVFFSLSPSSAELYIDGEKTDASVAVSLTYGLHQLIARADGYSSVTQYIRVAQESAGINVVLDTAEDGTDEDGDAESGDSSEAVTDYYKVYVDSPENAEVYLDGNYMGIAPCSFRKTAGTHVITLRRTGYETRSYTVEIDDEDKDISYSFAALLWNETSVSANSSAQ